MGAMKDFDRRIRQGGDDAIAAAAELWESREKILFDITDAFTKARWIPVSERLPVDIPHGYCLVTDGTNVGTANWSNSGNCFDHCIDRDYWKPTHWMPLPEPPAS